MPTFLIAKDFSAEIKKFQAGRNYSAIIGSTDGRRVKVTSVLLTKFFRNTISRSAMNCNTVMNAIQIISTMNDQQCRLDILNTYLKCA
jgi:hypothetical protein